MDQFSGETGYTHDAFTSVTWGNSSDTILWSDEMEDKQKKFKMQPKRRGKSSEKHGISTPETRRVGNMAAEKEALRSAQAEHICATLHKCEGNCEERFTTSHQGDKDVHVHVECEHGFVLISGERDDTLQPACFKVKCKAEGERWLKSQRLLPEPSTALFFEQVKGAIDVACTDMPDVLKETQVQHGGATAPGGGSHWFTDAFCKADAGGGKGEFYHHRCNGSTCVMTHQHSAQLTWEWVRALELSEASRRESSSPSGARRPHLYSARDVEHPYNSHVFGEFLRAGSSLPTMRIPFGNHVAMH